MAPAPSRFCRKGALLAPVVPASLLVSSKDLARRDKRRELPGTTVRPAIVACGDVDLIIIDWSLPGLSGAEVFARLRGDVDDRPVIVISAVASADDVAAMLSLRRRRRDTAAVEHEPSTSGRVGVCAARGERLWPRSRH